MRILFRTHGAPQIGLGHVTRCRDLARYLQTSGHDCSFLLDEDIAEIRPFLDGFDCDFAQNDPDDTITALKKDKVDILVLDDYRIDLAFEQQMKEHVPQLVVLDDILRPHHCDLLIDFRWRGAQTFKAYDTLCGAETQKLLGPAYAITPKKEPLNKKKDRFYHIMFGHGFFEAALILRIADKLDDASKIKYVQGPFDTINPDSLQKLKAHPKIDLVVAQTELFSLLQDIDLYIGAAGGILYQLRALNIPALTLATAPNQENPTQDLEDIGHFFHLSDHIEVPFEKLGQLIGVFKSNAERIKALGSKAKVQIDQGGAKRISDALTGKKVARPALVHSEKEYERLSDLHDLWRVDDTHLNRYLQARNHPNNQQRMIQSDAISQIDHYCWWFSTQRESYLLYEQKVAQLYIWHEVKQIRNEKFLIGGWFVVDEETNFQSALIALNWQLTHCDQKYAQIPWIAVIHKDNAFVKKLNEFVGFEDIDTEHPYHSVVKELFPNAHQDDFFPVMRRAQKQKAVG